MAKINDTTTFPNTAPALGDHVIGTDVSNVTNDAAGETVSFSWQAVMDLFEANMTVPSSVSAAYRTSTILSSTSNAEGAALIGVEDSGTFFAGANVEAVLAEIGALLPAEANADVTDETNVLAALSGATTTEVDPASGDKLLILDASDSDNIKNLTWSDVTAAAAAATPEGTAILSTGPVTDGYVLTADGAGGAAWEAAPGGAGGDAWSDVVDADILPTGAGSTYDIGSATATFAEGHFDTIYLGGTTLDGTTLADPGEDSFLIWDDSEGTSAWASLGTGLSATGTVISVDDTVFSSLTELASTANGDGAALIGIEDSGTLITATTVEGALAENRGLINSAAQKAGAVYTGTHDFGGADDLEIPNGATPTVDTAGQIAIDTTVTDWSHGILEYFSGETMGVVAMPIAQFTSPTDGYVVAYNATNDEFELVANSGSGLSNIVEDTTPQLGGDLDLNGNVITGMVIGTNIQAYDANLPTWPATVDATEVGYLNGVTSAIQTQIDGKEAADADILKADTTDNLTVGFTSSVADDGSKSGAATYAPDPATGNYKQIENAGAFTFNPPSPANDIAVSVSVLIINHATTAGTITTSGFTQVTGDSFDTTGGNKFLCRADVYDDGGTEYSLLQVVALQ